MVRLDLEKVATLKDKSKDNNNDNLTDISESSEPSKPFDEPSEPPEPPADEPAPDNSDDPDAPEELDDIEIDECHSEETTTEKRPDDRKMAGYAALREEDQKEDRLRQKETHFASKYVVPKTYRAAQYGRNEGWTPVLKKQMRYGKTLLGK
jgi:hypothetical protein